MTDEAPKTLVTAVLLRDRNPETTAAIQAAAGVPTWAETWANGVTTLTFDADLSDAQVAAVLDVMTSRDDADLARRRALIVAAAALDKPPGKNGNGAAAVSARVDATVDLLLALTAFVLGRDQTP